MISLLSLLVLSQSPEPLRALFSQQAEVSLVGEVGEWARLPLPEEVLTRVDRDLADVRLVDADGRLVPFVVQRERPLDPERRVQLVQLSATRKETPAGPGTPNLFEERAVFSLPGDRARTPRLEFSTSQPRFVRRVKIDALTERGDVAGHLETTLFRIAQAERLEVWLPALAGDVTRLDVTLIGQDDGFLAPVAWATFAERGPPPTTLEWPVTAAPVSEARGTVFRFERPRGLVPMRLSVKTSTPWFDRQVTVRSARAVLAEGRVFRQNGRYPIERLELPLGAIDDEQLEVRLDDEDSPPLEQLQLAFVIEQPELVFTVPAVQPLTLYFGGHRTHRARFDTSDTDVRLPFDLEASTLRAPKPNPDFVPASPLSAFRKPGAPVTPSDFAHQAWVRGVGADEVTSLTFDATHAQTMSADFHDLRLVDAQGLQWPYVLRERTATLPVRTTAARVAAAATSAWTFTLAGRVTALVLVPPTRTTYFSRSATVRFEREGQKPRVVWSGWLTFNPDDRGAETSLIMPLDGVARGEGTYTLELFDEGDAPLSDVTLEATVKVPQLTAVLAPGDYRALWGAAGVKGPRYDLERLADVLLELRSTPREVSAPEANAAFVAPTLLERTGGATRWLFWAVLGLAVVVLGAMTVRIARSETPPPAGGA